VAKVREHSRAGALVDAFADPRFCCCLAESLRAGERLELGGAVLDFRPTRALEDLYPKGITPVQHLSGEQSNTCVILGETFFLKAYRRLRTGIAPEIEMSRYLTEAGFPHSPALVGLVTLDRGSGPVALISLFEFVRNQGDVWAYTINHLERFAAIASDPGQRADAHRLYLSQVRTIGRRIGELHAALARPSGDPAFSPEPVDAIDLVSWSQELWQEADATFSLLRERATTLPEPLRPRIEQAIASRGAIGQLLGSLADRPLKDITKTRFHGDLHLGQILLSDDDFVITDFEGEPGRPLEQRRRKHLVTRDVAGMLRSFDYARAVALERIRTSRPDLEEVIGGALREWSELSTAAFLDGYDAGIGTASNWPRDAETRSTLVRILQIEKALYELRYELTTRPGWVHVPLDGLLALVI
jgi:maltose alpha-D-glucosyltransferase / alpha-amylase